MVTLGELAAHLALPLGDADPAIALHGIAPLGLATVGQLAFLAHKKYLADLPLTQAACVIVRAEWAGDCPVPTLCAEDPYLAYARASSLFEVAPRAQPGIHPLAAVHPDTDIGEGVSIGPGACVAQGVRLAAGVVVGAGASLGANVSVGEGTHIAPNVVIYHEVVIGAHCIIHACTVIGSDGFGFARGADGWEKIHQLGAVLVGDRVEIGAGVTIDRGALGDTMIADGVIIDNQVHIAHNCSIGERTAIAGCVGMAGSTQIGADCTFAGQVGVSGHLKICDNVHFTGQARVARSVSEPGTYSSGTPLEPVRQWGRNAVRFSQLDALHRRVVELERALADQLAADTESSRDDSREAGESGGEN